MPYYQREGKIQQPISDLDFSNGMQEGIFHKQKHRAFCVLLYYSAVRCSEALRVKKEQFQIGSKAILFDVGVRLKHGKQTPSLLLPLDAPYLEELKEAIEETKKDERVFPYCRMTGYNIVRRAFKYPHLFRLSRITNFFLEGYTVVQVRNWTGLTLMSLEYYLGIVDIVKMGESLKK
jgi:integrase